MRNHAGRRMPRWGLFLRLIGCRADPNLLAFWSVLATLGSKQYMSFSPFAALRVALLASSVLCVSAQEIIYDNTTTFLTTYAVEKKEFGDELELAGTARVLKEIAFEYFGSFAQQGDEIERIRLYSNDKQYDLYRKEPTRLLYESGLFGINPGFHAHSLQGFNTVLPDIVTMTVEFYGIAPTETAGLLLYAPPTVGFSYNELWRRNDAGKWEPIIYSTTDPNLKANISVRLKAVDVPKILSIKSTPEKVLQFSLGGLSGANYALEASADFKTWTLLTTQPVTGSTATFSTEIQTGQPHRFFRLRVP
jgi:hypothetical protein